MKINSLIIGAMSIGVGIAAAYCLYRYAKCSHGEKMRNELLQHIHDSCQWADKVLKHARDKALEDGVEVADRISKESQKVAEKLQRHMNAVAIE